MPNQNLPLNRAKEAKQDEFYTQLEDIQKELRAYKNHFKDKVVYCNCDDPEWSNFWKYFVENFELLGIRKLIATHYTPDSCVYKTEYNGKAKTRTPLTGDGDFRSDECVAILQQADIVVTNPPFSLWRDYFDQLIKYGKQFLILGNLNAITYKNVFPFMRDNKVWLGHSLRGGDIIFRVPDEYGSKKFDRDGNKCIQFSCIRWFTNMEFNGVRRRELRFRKRYNPVAYHKYDDHNAINVDKTEYIPEDYMGVMGVPISYMDRHDPEQFDLLSMEWAKVAGKAKYCRIFIQRRAA